MKMIEVEKIIEHFLNPPVYNEPKPKLPFVKITPDEIFYLDSMDNLFAWDENEKRLRFYASLCRE